MEAIKKKQKFQRLLLKKLNIFQRFKMITKIIIIIIITLITNSPQKKQ
jgi:hypothetical protein